MLRRGQRSPVGCAACAAVSVVLLVEIALLGAHVFGAMRHNADALLAEEPTAAVEAPMSAAAPAPGPWRWLGLVCAAAGAALTAAIIVLARSGGVLSPGLGYRHLLRMAVAAAAGGVLVFIMLSRPLPLLGGPAP